MGDINADDTIDIESMPIIVLSDDTPTVELEEAMTHLARAAKPLSRTRRDQVDRWRQYHEMIATIQDMLSARSDAHSPTQPADGSSLPTAQ